MELERILCVSGLTQWDAVGWGQAGSGCLGKEVERVMRDRVSIRLVTYMLMEAGQEHQIGYIDPRNRSDTRRPRCSLVILSTLPTAPKLPGSRCTPHQTISRLQPLPLLTLLDHTDHPS